MFLDNSIIKNNKNNFRVYEYNGSVRLYVPKELKNKKIVIDNNYNVKIDNDKGVPVNNQLFISISKIDNDKIAELKNNILKLKIS